MLKAGVGSPSIMAASGFMKLPANGVDAFAVEGIADHPYDIPNQRIAYGRARARAAGLVLALGRAFAERLLHRELHRRDGGGGEEGPVRVPPRAARQAAALQGRCSNSRPRRPAGASRCRPACTAASRWRRASAATWPRSPRSRSPPTARRKVHRVVAAVDCGMTVNPEIIRAPDRERDRLRPQRGAVRQDQLQGRHASSRATSTTIRCCA